MNESYIYEMKPVFTIFLVLLIFAYNLKTWLIVISFELNRNYILENVCVERDEPINMCGGSCYLGTQLEMGSQQDKNTIPETTFKFSLSSYFLIEKLKDQNIWDFRIKQKFAHFKLNPEPQLNLSSIFHPPKF